MSHSGTDVHKCACAHARVRAHTYTHTHTHTIVLRFSSFILSASMSSPLSTSSWKDSSLSCPALEVDECDDPPRLASGVVPRPFFLVPAFMHKV